MTWKIMAQAPREAVAEALDWDGEIVVAGSEVAEDRPEDWRFEAWLPREPTAGDRAGVAALFGGEAPEFMIEELPETDWVRESQLLVAPIVAGRFRVRTPDHAPQPAVERFELVVPASQAFGTGHHATTAGCLEMLSAIAARGHEVRSFADVGTGTGLLAFAARLLWPAARGIASDIDPVCERVVRENAALNAVPVGSGVGELGLVVAAGLDHPELRARAAYALIVANILAAPLIELAPAFADALRPGGHLVLAGLLTSQENAVRAACERSGLAFAERLIRGDWSILWLRR